MAPVSSELRRCQQRGDSCTLSGSRKRMAKEIPPEWLEEFEAAARRPLEVRLRYAFIKTYKPVMDDEPFRAFDTMEQYRRWCQENLPRWLGYARV